MCIFVINFPPAVLILEKYRFAIEKRYFQIADM